MAQAPYDTVQHMARLYWEEICELKLRSVDLRLSRDRLAVRVRLVERIKAVASSGAVAGWLVWKDLPILWSALIMAAQLLDAVKHTLPYAQQHAAAARLASLLDFMFIDAQYEWEHIRSGAMEPGEIARACHQVRRRRAEAVHAHDLCGWISPRDLAERAREETESYMRRYVRRDGGHGPA